MPPDPSLRPDRPRPKHHRIRPTSTPSSYPVPRSFSSPVSRRIFGDENRLPFKSSDSSSDSQGRPGMSESKSIGQSRARDVRRPGSELAINVDRTEQEQARLSGSVGIKPSSNGSSSIKLPSSPSRPLPITGKDQSRPEPTSSSRSTDLLAIELSKEPQSRTRSPSCSLTPLSSDPSPSRSSQQEPDLPQSPDKPIYVFQSGRPKRRVTIEKEKKKSGGISSQGSSGCSGSQSSGDGSQVKKEEEVDSQKEARVERPKRVRIRDRVKERNRARELRRLRKVDKERRVKEDEFRRKRRENIGSGSSSTPTSVLYPENGVSIQPLEVRSSGSGRLTRSRARVLPLSEVRSYRGDPNSAGQSSSSPSSCTSTRSQNHDLRSTSGPASTTDGLMGPEDIEAALIIGNLSRDARWIAVESKMPSWNMPHGVDTKDPHWNRMDSFEGMKEVVRAWKTCERCGVQFLVGQKGVTEGDDLRRVCRSCGPYTDSVFAPYDFRTLPPILYKQYLNFDPKYEDGQSTTQRARLPPIQTSMPEYAMRPASESEVSTILSTDREDESGRHARVLTEYLALPGPSRPYTSSHEHRRDYQHYGQEREADCLGGINGPITRYAMSQGLACLPTWTEGADPRLNPVMARTGQPISGLETRGDRMSRPGVRQGRDF